MASPTTVSGGKQPLFFILVLFSTSSFRNATEATNNSHFILPVQTPNSCKKSSLDTFHEYFDISNLTCVSCSQNSTIQTVSTDGLTCVCTELYKLTRNHGGGSITCERCPEGKVTSSEGWECIACATPPSTSTPEVECSLCESAKLTAERDLDGQALISVNRSEVSRQCVSCISGSSPNMPFGRCARCNADLRVQTECGCTEDRLTGGLCFPRTESLEPNYPELYTMNFKTESNFRSVYFENNIRAAHGACAPSWSNLTACQQIANMCVLLLYDLTNAPPTEKTCGATGTKCNDACSLYLRLAEYFPTNRLPSHNASNARIPQWRYNMAWLFYPPNTAGDLRQDSSLPTSFHRGSQLNLTVARYNVSGHFLGYHSAWANDVTLCKRPSEDAVLFGAQLRFECHIKVSTLLNTTQETTFYEINMPYALDGEDRFYAIPILVRNLKDKTESTPNTDADATKWQFTRRFHLLDTTSGRDAEGVPLKVLRYVKTSRLHVTLRDKEGQIYVPWLELEYAEVNQNQYGKNEKVQVIFEVVYSMDLSKHQLNLSIAIGVLSGLALLYSAFQAYNYNRRQGQVAIDCTTLFYMVLHSCGTLSNAFFVVMFGMSIWWFLLYKLQDTTFLIPTTEGDFFIKAFLGSAFALKTISIIYLIVSQCSVDIFFMDWERSKISPDPVPSRSLEETRPGASKVSIWRTYFVANEWNELSTLRSINMAALLFLVVFLLKALGLENLARLEQNARLTVDVQGEGIVEWSRVLRFAISGMVYIGCALILWMLHHFVLKVFVHCDRLASFCDLSAICNVSTFVMTHEQYGYYIHGRSPHGYADLGLKDFYVNLNKEQANLCGERGLVIGTEDQMFEIALPKRLRSDYNKVLQPLQKARARQRMRTNLGNDIEGKLTAYDVLNKFLQNFIDHNFPGLDYIVTHKNLFEKIMDTETNDNRDLGYFYTDNGHSFDKTLLYGNERTLQVYFLLFFTMVDLIGTNFILSATLTFILDQFICRVRYGLGRRNIANKTMVDLRFLI